MGIDTGMGETAGFEVLELEDYGIRPVAEALAIIGGMVMKRARLIVSTLDPAPVAALITSGETQLFNPPRSMAEYR
jgi:hypothetical protein